MNGEAANDFKDSHCRMELETRNFPQNSSVTCLDLTYFPSRNFDSKIKNVVLKFLLKAFPRVENLKIHKMDDINADMIAKTASHSKN